MKTIILITTLILIGCASSGTKIDPNLAASFKEGVTTQSDVIAAFGPPNSTGRLPNGDSYVGYSHASVKMSPAGFIPIVGIFLNHSDVNSGTSMFMFDRDGKLKNTSTNQTSASGGLFQQQ